MKSTINEQNTKTKSEYPCLKVIEVNGLKTVVLFEAPQSGVCVYSNNRNNEFFEKSTMWSESAFKPFNGTVTLSND